MKKLKVLKLEEEKIYFGIEGKHPCLFSVTNINFHEIDPQITMHIDWINKGCYTNIRLKKMLRRKMNSILRSAVKFAKEHPNGI